MLSDRKNKRRVGLVGAGWVTGYHLPAWQRLGGRVELVGIADPNLDVAKTRAAAFGIADSYASAEAMFDAAALDIVDICAPREHHAALVRLAASRGIDILCQKPLAVNLAEAEALVDNLPASPRVMVHENWRFRAWYRRLKAWLDQGMAGEIRQVRLDFLSSGMLRDTEGLRPALVRQPFFARQQRLLVMEVLIHQLDSLRFLIGEMDVVAARLERSNDDIIAEDVAAITLRRRADGALVQVTGNLAVHGAPPAPRDQLRIIGTAATLELEGNRLSAAGIASRDESFDPDATYQGSYDAATAHFVDGLDSGSPFETSPRDNLETLRLVEEIYRLAAFDPAAKPR
ncbi:Gfo/Idh/MocA family protein [Devosia psychrophila]|uniref:Inositol 2-dehydrogenase n=1 Tax=Devosia psychrophila TaxID=728005 RepID=A0A0F5Q1C1_9HYPH|nr:Gfo/Idh/MocA family oxidoreductase [Devosia psychrophila]KKC33879.1 inositol 2-dehydrogenase [Devosia psychrophila]SFD10707.1 Predicted dehydrogenase [Devosia psychrophila]